MPSAPLSPCRGRVGCPSLTQAGVICAICRPTYARRSASAQGYTSYWRAFRLRFVQLLIRAGLAPICGAALPDGPAMRDSICKAEGRTNGAHLHLDHDPPLTPAERSDRRIVCDPQRVGFLCASCHAHKTNREQRARSL
jgi:hypothetical protein